MIPAHQPDFFAFSPQSRQASVAPGVVNSIMDLYRMSLRGCVASVHAGNRPFPIIFIAPWIYNMDELNVLTSRGVVDRQDAVVSTCLLQVW